MCNESKEETVSKSILAHKIIKNIMAIFSLCHTNYENVLQSLYKSKYIVYVVQTGLIVYQTNAWLYLPDGNLSQCDFIIYWIGLVCHGRRSNDELQLPG